ncbi:MAG: response regulator [Ginsengibacter sp.]
MCKTKLNVLVVDDDAIYQFTAKKTLEATGYINKIFVCSNGEEAYRLLKSNLLNTQEIPDVIFLDINMPVMNGWDFLRAYEGLQINSIKNVRIFLVSSSVNEIDLKYSREFPTVQDYIVKPILKEKLSEIFQNIALADVH